MSVKNDTALLRGINGCPARGVIRVKRDDGIIVFLSIIDLYPPVSGKYRVAISLGKTKVFDLGDLSGGKFAMGDLTVPPSRLAVAVTDGDGEDAPVVAYGAMSSEAPTAERLVAEAYLPETEKYDDEKVATENYYEFDRKKGDEDETAGFVGGDPQSDVLDEGRSEKEEDTPRGDETFRKKGGKTEDRIAKTEEILKTHPPEKDLCAVIADGRFARIGMGKDKYYVVGLLGKEPDAEWICYGVPGVFGAPPEEAGKGWSFVPSSVFEPKGKGYWMLFERARG